MSGEREGKRPYVRFFASDWLAGTRGMKATETGIYITLIAMMYERCEPLPEDSKRLARQCGCSPRALADTLEMLIADGKIIRVEGGLWNERVQKEFDFRAEKTSNAKQAVESRWQKTKEIKGRSIRTNNDCNADDIPYHIPYSIFQNIDKLFDEFWQAYPSRGQAANPKKPALAKFAKLIRDGTDPAEIVAGAKGYARHCRATEKGGTEFVMQATRFLNQAVYQQYAGPLLSVVKDDDPPPGVRDEIMAAVFGNVSPRTHEPIPEATVEEYRRRWPESFKAAEALRDKLSNGAG